jgi:hypothetical protein
VVTKLATLADALGEKKATQKRNTGTTTAFICFPSEFARWSYHTSDARDCRRVRKIQYQ